MLKVLKYLYPFSLVGGDEDNPPAPTNPDDPAPILSPEEVLDIKTNFVPKKDYEALEGNYRKLAESILNGGELPANPNGEEAPDMAQLRKELYDPNNSLSNLDYVKKTLQLREAYIQETGKDPFLPTGINGDPFKNDQEKLAAEQSAQKVAKVLQEAVDEANGDPETFDIILSKLIK